jgi:hypothetical protein
MTTKSDFFRHLIANNRVRPEGSQSEVSTVFIGNKRVFLTILLDIQQPGESLSNVFIVKRFYAFKVETGAHKTHIVPLCGIQTPATATAGEDWAGDTALAGPSR